MQPTSRNDPCPCGSGKRYKHCHGGAAASSAPGADDNSRAADGARGLGRAALRGPGPLHLEALAAHRAGLISRAADLYRRALAERPDDAESLQMLGMVEFERMHYRVALAMLIDANHRTGWSDPVFRQNLGLVLAKVIGRSADTRQAELVGAYLERARVLRAAPVLRGRVSVVLLGDAGATEIARSIESVAAQSATEIELVVAGDTNRNIDLALAAWRSECPAVVVGATGFVQAANRGAERATGDYVAFLGAGDRFAPERIARMTAELARAEPQWGFSRVGVARSGDGTDADDGHEGAGDGRRARDGTGDALYAGNNRLLAGDFRGDEPASFTLLRHDLIRSRGNLFVHRKLFLELGGFRDVDEPAWDFALRASRVVEPVAVPARLYFCDGRTDSHQARVGSRNGPADDPRNAAADACLAGALAGDPAATNMFSPHHPSNRELVLRGELRAGRGDRIPVEVLRAAAVESLARVPVSAPVVARTATDQARVALVVLGVYRSGTSAIARALNLCGAALPERLVAPRLAINPKGFWEPEAITDLDARLLHHLGADWNSVDVALPGAGALVDEFLDQARELLAREYGDARLILIKDPRISMLAPLWHRALIAASYRPAYLVALRHPLDVARSFAGQGDMPVVSGLALWHAYMQRIESFTAGIDARVAWLRYTTLLDDWSRALERVASCLELMLDTRSRASELDAFLEQGMRNYRAEDGSPGDDPDAHPRERALTGERWRELRALYRRLVARCDAGASDDRST